MGPARGPRSRGRDAPLLARRAGARRGRRRWGAGAVRSDRGRRLAHRADRPRPVAAATGPVRAHRRRPGRVAGTTADPDRDRGGHGSASTRAWARCPSGASRSGSSSGTARSMSSSWRASWRRPAASPSRRVHPLRHPDRDHRGLPARWPSGRARRDPVPMGLARRRRPARPGAALRRARGRDDRRGRDRRSTWPRRQRSWSRSCATCASLGSPSSPSGPPAICWPSSPTAA